MKWFLLIVTLIVGGCLAYYLFFPRQPAVPTTPREVARAYVEAARKGDEAKIRSLCTAAAADEAVRLAPEVRAMVAKGTFGFQAMKADPPRKGLCLVAGGRLLGLQLVEVDGRWKIEQIGLSAM